MALGDGGSIRSALRGDLFPPQGSFFCKCGEMDLASFQESETHVEERRITRFAVCRCARASH
jgi:hypothetical protein